MQTGDVELSDGVVVLRPLQHGDAGDHLAGEDAELVLWLSGGIGTIGSVRSYIERAQQMWADHGPIFTFAIRSAADDTLLGTIDVQLDHGAYGPNRANLAYGLYPAWRGRGFATRAVNLALDFLRPNATVHSVLIRVDPANVSSAGVARRAGFALTVEAADTCDGLDRYEFDVC